MIRKGPSQPRFPRFPFAEREIPHEAQVAQEMADPMGHMSEEMKKKFLELYLPDYGPNGPPTLIEPTPPAPKPTESTPGPC